MKRILLILLTLVVGLQSLHAERVKVRLFCNQRIPAIYVSFDLGLYDLYANDTMLLEQSLGEGMSVELLPASGAVSVAVNGYEYGTFRNVILRATDTACIMCLNPKGVKQRTYEGDLVVSAIDKGYLQILNEVDFETYLAGVVQSEIYGTQSDIFRVQAIISRTWALRNMKKHRADGYNFCDYVHCQAYQNRCVRPDIMLGTMQSSGETIVDADGKLIETPFHSNSGGETANSEDVWRSALPYLRSVPDTFSYRMRQSNWTKVIPRDKWLNYFAKTHKINLQDSTAKATLLTFSQPHRQAKLLGVPLTRVRTDFGLKSTFFSVGTEPTSGDIVLSGHGYGHGVGLSQEGTIRMVGLGISYDSIIHHYYTGSHILYDESHPHNYVENYIKQIAQIIEEDKQQSTQTKSKKDDWLGRLFRIRDREEREEVYDPSSDELDSDWQYDW